MTLTLAFRNLFHDRIRLAVTLVGILFSIVLVAVQLGLYLGARNIIVSMIDRADGDLWIMAYGTKNFEEAQPISVREKFAALSTPGVAKATPLIVAFTDWRKPTGGSTIVVLVGADARGRRPEPLEHRRGRRLRPRRARCRDRRQELSVRPRHHGRRRHRADRRIAGARRRPHRGHPLVHRHALRLHHAQSRAQPCSTCRPTTITYVLVKLEPGADVEAVRKRDARKRARQRGADQGRVPRRAASTTGCSRPAPAWR